VNGTSGPELLEAVRRFLREEVVPELDGFRAYNTRIAANAVGIAARELEQGWRIAELDGQIAAELALDPSAGPVATQVAVGLRDGTLNADARLLDYLRRRTLCAIAIDNPRYSGLAQARALWGE